MSIKKQLKIAGCLIVGISLMSNADVYRWVDDEGNVEFTDEPREGAVKIEVGPTATITLPKLKDVGGLDTENDEQTPARDPYNKLDITFPKNDAAFTTGTGEVTVMMDVAPSLYPNHSLRLTLDGTQVTTKEQFFKFQNVNRGTHQLSVDIIDNSNVVKAGPKVSFTVHRPIVRKKN